MKGILFAALLALGLTVISMPSARAQSPQEILRQYVSDLQKNPNDNALREKIIRHVQTMRPAPAVPEEARKYINRGMAAAEDAKNEKDYRDAVDEFQKAVNLAPWLGSGYRGLAVTQDKSGQYPPALQNLKFFLLTNPSEADAEAARTLRDKIEYRMEKAAKESSPEAIAAKRQSEYETWLKKLDGRRYTSSQFTGGLGVIDISGSILIVGSIGPGLQGPEMRVPIRGREALFQNPNASGVFPTEISFTISESGDSVTERRRFSDGDSREFTYYWQR